MLDLHKEQLNNLTELLKNGVQSILVLGDKGVGKKNLFFRSLQVYTAVYHYYDVFGIEDARHLKSQLLRRISSRHYFLIDGDNASDQAYNAILKLLEEPPPNTAFIITSSKQPIQTIVSRCHIIMVPPLTNEELKQVLLFTGMSERTADSIVPLGRGSVTTALNAYSKQEEKRRLIPFIRALKNKDLTFVFQQIKTITQEDINLLVELIDDVFLARYGLINPELVNLVSDSPDILMKIKDSLISGRIPSICWLRAYFNLNKS